MEARSTDVRSLLKKLKNVAKKRLQFIELLRKVSPVETFLVSYLYEKLLPLELTLSLLKVHKIYR